MSIKQINACASRGEVVARVDFLCGMHVTSVSKLDGSCGYLALHGR